MKRAKKDFRARIADEDTKKKVKEAQSWDEISATICSTLQRVEVINLVESMGVVIPPAQSRRAKRLTILELANGAYYKLPTSSQ